MTRETQSKLLGEFYAEKKNVLKLKGEDYANEDVLSNFKTAGANIGISAEQQCLSLIATKVARLGNLLSGKTPNNESVSDSILDLSNYTDLLYCLVNEEEENLITQDDLGKIKSAFNKNKADFLKRKHAKSQPLTIEECFGKYKLFNNAPNGFDIQNNKNRAIIAESEKLNLNTEDILGFKVSKAQEKRWENVKPKAIINQINWSDVNEPIKEEDIFYKGGEPITEPYEPKVGDKFYSKGGIFNWKIRDINDKFIIMNAIGCECFKQRLSFQELLSMIKSKLFRKIN